MSPDMRAGKAVITVILCLASLAFGFAGGYFYHRITTSGQRAITVECLRILDPDTIEVSWKGAKEKVRFAGIDAPEKKEGKKLNDQAKMLGVSAEGLLQMSRQVIQQMDLQVKGRQVDLVFPHGKVEHDSFGRLLAYIEISGKDTGEMLLRNGLVYPRKEPHPRRDRYIEVNEQAKAQRKGMYAYAPKK